MSRTRVLFLTASYPTPEEPLLGVFVQAHAHAVAAHCDVAVVHLERAPVRQIRVTEQAGEDFPTWRVSYPRSPAPLSYLGNLAAAAAGYRAVRRSGFAPDVLHAHFFLAGVPAVLLGRLLRKPVVVTEQWSVFLPGDPATLSPLVRRAARFALEGADTVMPVSEALRDGIRAHGIEPQRVEIVPNVFDAELFHPPLAAASPNGEARRLLSVGALYEATGMDYLLEAVALLGRERRDFHVEVVGDGDLRGELEAQRRRLGIEELVSLAGWRTKPEVAELMRGADLFVLTSRYDSNPCALIEALGTGLPVVATAVGGIPGMLSERSGLLAEPRDPQSIARQLAAVLDAPQRYDRAAIAAEARARYGAEQVGGAFARIYADALGRRA
jgi:glycosyltransferase involved in cell wall biosynthesis